MTDFSHLVHSQTEIELGRIAKFEQSKLLSRPEWGEFEYVADHLARIFRIASHLRKLPLEYLPIGANGELNDCLPLVRKSLEQIDDFKPAPDSDGVREQIARDVRNASVKFESLAVQYFPYLAFMQAAGSVDRLIANVESEIGDAIKKVKSDVEEIGHHASITAKASAQAQEAAGISAGAVFTKEFADEADKLEGRSTKWLRATMALAVLTVATAFWFATRPEASQIASDGLEALKYVVNRGAILAVLFTGTVWCGRIYRALTHQATINRHRALSLKTFEAFVRSTNDDRIRDTVLMAVTRTIFGHVPTGLVSDSGAGQESGVNFVEIGQSSTEKAVGAAANSG